MIPVGSAFHVHRLERSDLVGVAQCIVLDAQSFPYASAAFGIRDIAACVWVARAGVRKGAPADILGFAVTRRRREGLHLEGLAVRPRERRRGIARELLRTVLNRAAQDGEETVSLHVSVANRAAMTLYREEGFFVCSRLRGFYPPAAFGGATDAYEMVRRVGAG